MGASHGSSQGEASLRPEGLFSFGGKMLKNPAKEMQKYLDQNKRKYQQTKFMKAYRMADEFGKGYEVIEMQKAVKGKKK
jgi:hypothetical protein